MAKSKVSDTYANKAYGDVVMSAANTMTFAQILFGVGLFEGKALLIHRASWYPTPTALREIVAATDTLQMALTTSNRLSAISDVSEPAIICARSIVGIAANTEPFTRPMVDDFTGLPGGGLLVPANPIYIAAHTSGAAAASEVRVEIRFSFLELSDSDYLEVLQSLFPANIA